MTLLECLLIFFVIVLVLWLVSALVGRGADIEMIENYRDLCDDHEQNIVCVMDQITKLQAENKQLKHDLEQYKDGCDYQASQACSAREKIADLQDKIREARKALQ